MSRRILAACSCILILATAGAARATENGVVAYPSGLNTFMAGAIPDPGQTWFQNYTVFYKANTFTNGVGNSAVPGFRADIVANATRLFHTWDVQLGPFSLASGFIAVPVLNANVGSALGSRSNFGVGDIILQPMYLGWSNADKTFFGYTGVDVFVPTGGPTSNKIYTINPYTTFTWMPTPTLDISGSIGAEFHSKNKDTDYQSGGLFLLDWGVNWRAFEKIPQVTIGLGGYAVKQFSDDKLQDVVYQDGNRQQGFGIGPQISYGGPNGGVVVKWQREFATRNRTAGDRIWVQLLVPLK